MEGLGLGTIVLVLVAIWYFGGMVNAIIAKSGKMAEKEYSAFEREQAFRIRKGQEDLKTKVEKFQKESKSEMTNEELDAYLGV
jgi:Zn-finger nucleic acid-binding protein